MLMILGEGEPSWVVEQSKSSKRTALIEQKLELEGRLKKIRAQKLRQKLRYESGESQPKRFVRMLLAFLNAQLLKYI